VAFVPPPSADVLLSLEAGAEGGGAKLDADGVYRPRKKAGSGARLFLWTGRIDEMRVLEATLPDGFDKPYLRLPLPQTRVHGQLVAVPGAPASTMATKVDIVSQGDGAILGRGGAGEEGTFSAAYLPPGAYILRVDGRPLSSFQLAEGQSLDLGRLEMPAPPDRPASAGRP